MPCVRTSWSRTRIAFDGVLGRRVECVIGRRDQPEYRTEVDNTAPCACRLITGRTAFVIRIRAEHIHIEYGLRLCRRGFLSAAKQSDPGIVDEKIDPPNAA